MTISLHIDTRRTGNFAHADDNVSDLLVFSESTLGFDNVFNDVSSNTSWRFTLVDTEGKFNVDSASGINILGCMARLQLGGTTVLKAWIVNVIPTQLQYGWETEVRCSGRMSALEAAVLPRSDLKQSQDLRDELAGIFPHASVPYPYPSHYFLLDSSELDDGQLYGGVASDAGYVLGTETRNIPFVPEREKGIVSNYLGQLIGYSIGGRFFERRDGKFEYKSLADQVTQASSISVESSDLSNIVAFQGNVINSASIVFSPKDVREDALLWRQGSESIDIVEDRLEVQINYFSPDDDKVERIYRLSSDRVDYTFESTDDDASVSARIVDRDSKKDGTTIVFTKDSDEICTVYGATLIGSGIFESQRELVNISNPESRKNYGDILVSESSNIFVTNEALAKSYVKRVVDLYADGETLYQSVEIVEPEDRFIAGTIGDVVNVSNASTGHSKKYIIISESFIIRNGIVILRWGLFPQSDTIETGDYRLYRLSLNNPIFRLNANNPVYRVG